jgi:hypothetical protein
LRDRCCAPPSRHDLSASAMRLPEVRHITRIITKRAYLPINRGLATEPLRYGPPHRSDRCNAG